MARHDAREGRLTCPVIYSGIFLPLYPPSLSLFFSLRRCGEPTVWGNNNKCAARACGSERIYTGGTSIQYLNARSNTGDKRELYDGIARAACNDLETPFGQRAPCVPLRTCVCIHTGCPILLCTMSIVKKKICMYMFEHLKRLYLQTSVIVVFLQLYNSNNN